MYYQVSKRKQKSTTYVKGYIELTYVRYKTSYNEHQNWQIFSVMDQIVNILSFVGQLLVFAFITMHRQCIYEDMVCFQKTGWTVTLSRLYLAPGLWFASQHSQCAAVFLFLCAASLAHLPVSPQKLPLFSILVILLSNFFKKSLFVFETCSLLLSFFNF